jgi:serine/threonine protein kinase
MQLYTPGTLIGQRYRITRLLGSGGMSAAYEACDSACDMPVALKQNGLPRHRAAWAKAARQLADVDHPNLPRVENLIDMGDAQFLVMEYIGGSDLEELLQAGFTPATDDVLDWADQLLDALACLHQRRPAIVHRAVRPNHLKLTARGRVILLDARLLPDDAGSAAARRVDPYVAPEVSRGGRLDVLSDIYGLAATLYRLLSGIPPVDAASRREIVSQKIADPLQPIHETATQVPLAVGAALHMGMALDPRERPQTAAHFQSLLRQARDGHTPVVPTPPRSGIWSRRWLGA